MRAWGSSGYLLILLAGVNGNLLSSCEWFSENVSADVFAAFDQICRCVA